LFPRGKPICSSLAASANARHISQAHAFTGAIGALFRFLHSPLNTVRSTANKQHATREKKAAPKAQWLVMGYVCVLNAISYRAHDGSEAGTYIPCTVLVSGAAAAGREKGGCASCAFRRCWAWFIACLRASGRRLLAAHRASWLPCAGVRLAVARSRPRSSCCVISRVSTVLSVLCSSGGLRGEGAPLLEGGYILGALVQQPFHVRHLAASS
jgi:hypothetical protein